MSEARIEPVRYTDAYPLAAFITAFGDAGLPAVPPDPFDGKPMRLAKIGGNPVVYSVGKDGRDDGGLHDSEGDRHEGDLTFRLRSR